MSSGRTSETYKRYFTQGNKLSSPSQKGQLRQMRRRYDSIRRMICNAEDELDFLRKTECFLSERISEIETEIDKGE